MARVYDELRDKATRLLARSAWLLIVTGFCALLLLKWIGQRPMDRAENAA